MTTRERIEAEIARLNEEANGSRLAAAEYLENTYKKSEFLTQERKCLESVAFLRSILAELEAETPFTLAEARESGKWFALRGKDPEPMEPPLMCKIIPKGLGKTGYYLQFGSRFENLENQLEGLEIKRLHDCKWWPVEEEK